MTWGHRLVSRLGFGTGAAMTTLVIAGVYAITSGHVNLGTLTGEGSTDRSTVSALGPKPAPTDATGNAGVAGNVSSPSGSATHVPNPSGTTAAGDPVPPATSSARRSTPASRADNSRPAVATSTPAATTTTSTTELAEQVLAQINQARTVAGVPALEMSVGLVKSAEAHNKVMAAGCGLSHQCTSEADLGKRITAQGVTWTAAGENIGQGGPEPDQGEAIVAMAKQLTSDMLAETAPNDGHKKNLLSKNFKHVGIHLYRDPNGTVWMTQDFAS